ncbi:MAG: 3-oxoacyl-ACP synthase III family protein [Myxococcaceae bacterium]
MNHVHVGILGLGASLPDEVRTNAFWPRPVVERWEKKMLGRGAEDTTGLTGGARLAVEANAKLASDPFKGSIERRVMSGKERASDLETRAAREAIERSGIDPQDINLLVGFSYCPDVLLMPNAAIVHKNLGLSKRCFTIPVDAACNSFLVQLSLAEQMIAGGQARYALLVQSSTPSRLLPMDEPHSTMFGDGATAVVVGPVGAGRGVIARAHRTDGSFGRTLVCTIPGKEWFDEGRPVLHVEDRAAAHRMFLGAADFGKEVLDACLAEAGLSPADVGFFASHQGTSWFRGVVQEYAGLTNAKSVDTYPWAGSLTGCNIPLVLHVAQREGLLRDGEVVAMYSGGTGIIYSGLLLRWGR